VPNYQLHFVLSLALAAAIPCHHAGADVAPPRPAVIVKTLTGDEVVEPNGSYTTIFHVEKLATNESAAHNIAQYTLEYSESMETAEILEAFTRKADGKVLEVDRTQIFSQAPPGSPQVPKFTDRKQKVVVFPDVVAEDMVVYTVKRTRKPSFLGQFYSGDVFQRGLAFEYVRVNITLPKAMASQVEAQGVDHQVEDAGQSITHKFFDRNPRPTAAEPAALSPWDTDPHYIISTFADYAAVATAYRQLAAGKAAVTPRIQALADEITADTTDRREQAHRIYDWVSKHIRYVAVFLGNGGYEPHDSASILENGYGDCKDHVVLLEALLKAKGIASMPTLIDSGNRYRASQGRKRQVIAQAPPHPIVEGAEATGRGGVARGESSCLMIAPAPMKPTSVITPCRMCAWVTAPAPSSDIAVCTKSQLAQAPAPHSRIGSFRTYRG
jgi:hypothetical protein